MASNLLKLRKYLLLSFPDTICKVDGFQFTKQANIDFGLTSFSVAFFNTNFSLLRIFNALLPRHLRTRNSKNKVSLVDRVLQQDCKTA